MIWNPWKEIKRLRDQVDLYVNMAFEEGRKANYLKFENEYLQEKIDKLTKLDRTNMDGFHASIMDRADNLLIALQAIIAEERPTSNATVKRMARIARTALGK
jgi:hypothetical protein